jgi:hypothetical protein
VLLDCSTYRVEDVAVLDDVVEVVVTRYYSGGTAIIRPQTVSVWYLFPVVFLSVVCVDLVTFDLGKLFSGFVESV